MREVASSNNRLIHYFISRSIRRQAEAIRLENHEKQWRQLIEKYNGQEKIKTITIKINNFLKQ